MKHAVQKTGLDMWSTICDLAQYKKSCKIDLSEIRKSLRDTDSMTKRGTLHEARIHLKRILALRQIFVRPKSKTKSLLFKPYLTLFDIAGKLRQSQLEYGIINPLYGNSAESTAYLHELHRDKKHAEERIKKMNNKELKLKIVRAEKGVGKFLTHLTRKQFESAITKQETDLYRLIDKNSFREQKLHEVRSRLKAFYLVLEAAGAEPAQQWAFLLNLLGEWHDLQIAFDHIIKAIYSGKHSEYDLIPMRELKMKILTKKMEAFESVQRQFSSIKKYRQIKNIPPMQHRMKTEHEFEFSESSIANSVLL